MERFKLEDNNKISAGFNPPESYFISFAERLTEQLPERETPVIPLYNKASVWMTAVAAVLIVALGLTFYFRMDATPQPDDAMIENYLAYQSSITSYDLIQQLDKQDLKELEQSISMTDVSHDVIEEYLLDQNVNVYE